MYDNNEFVMIMHKYRPRGGCYIQKLQPRLCMTILFAMRKIVMTMFRFMIIIMYMKIYDNVDKLGQDEVTQIINIPK